MGLGWGTDAINLKLTTTYSLVDCYKTLLNDVSDYSDTWTGMNAQWIDSCAFGSLGSEITLQNFVLSAAVAQQSVIGGSTVDGPGCFKFADWLYWAPFYENLVLYGL